MGVKFAALRHIRRLRKGLRKRVSTGGRVFLSSTLEQLPLWLLLDETVDIPHDYAGLRFPLALRAIGSMADPLPEKSHDRVITDAGKEA